MTLTERKKSSSLIKSIAKSYGSIAKLAAIIDQNYSVTWKWVSGNIDVPLRQAYILSKISKYSMSELRPDLEKTFKKVEKNIKKKLDA